MSEYRPFQHRAQPYGCAHMTVFANVELWEDDPPDAIVLGPYRYELKKPTVEPPGDGGSRH